MMTILGYVLLALGFGFVIFWHELGHFLAAKWARVKVEQFAVGFGTAALAWRKGLGFRLKSTRQEYERRCLEYLRSIEGKEAPPDIANAKTDDQRLDAAGRALGMGETEYRLNWLPLGGYVKMLGQDDMNPNNVVDDPRAYNTQTIAKRMVIVSAGVIMNVILAAMLFFGLFLMGFNVHPSVVGSVRPGSPAQAAGLQVGDRIISLDGEEMLDFTKIVLGVALLDESRPAPIVIDRPDDNGNMVRQTLNIRARRSDADTRGILALGITHTGELRGYDRDEFGEILKYDPEIHGKSFAQVQPGETIVAIGDRSVADPEPASAAKDDKKDPNDIPSKKFYFLLDRALNASDGKPVEVTVKAVDGKLRKELVEPTFVPRFSMAPLEFFGMTPRSMIPGLTTDSVARGKILPGDVVAAITLPNNDVISNPTQKTLSETLDKAGRDGTPVKLTVLRDGKLVELEALEASVKLDSGKRGIGIGIDYDTANPVIAAISKDSSAAKAGIPRGATIIRMAGQDVKSWHDVRRIGAKELSADQSVPVVVRLPDSDEERAFELRPSQADIELMQSYRYTHDLLLRERIDPRKTSNPITAAGWGVRETRDLILQFYLTLKRMFQGSIPVSNAMGPVGIVQAGARLSERGTDWLIWFLAQISANLAVVNFLPIPIVDGGLFAFLIVEKLRGRPVSSRIQSIAQVVGLALIVSVFLFVTYQDIMR